MTLPAHTLGWTPYCLTLRVGARAVDGGVFYSATPEDASHTAARIAAEWRMETARSVAIVSVVAA